MQFYSMSEKVLYKFQSYLNFSTISKANSKKQNIVVITYVSIYDFIVLCREKHLHCSLKQNTRCIKVNHFICLNAN